MLCNFETHPDIIESITVQLLWNVWTVFTFGHAGGATNWQWGKSGNSRAKEKEEATAEHVRHTLSSVEKTPDAADFGSVSKDHKI